MVDNIREHVKEIVFLADVFFLKIKKKCVEYSETKKYAKIFSEFYSRVKMLDISKNIVFKYWNYFSFRTKVFSFKIIHFRLFLFQKHKYLFM